MRIINLHVEVVFPIDCYCRQSFNLKIDTTVYRVIYLFSFIVLVKFRNKTITIAQHKCHNGILLLEIIVSFGVWKINVRESISLSILTARHQQCKESRPGIQFETIYPLRNNPGFISDIADNDVAPYQTNDRPPRRLADIMPRGNRFWTTRLVYPDK